MLRGISPMHGQVAKMEMRGKLTLGIKAETTLSRERREPSEPLALVFSVAISDVGSFADGRGVESAGLFARAARPS